MVKVWMVVVVFMLIGGFMIVRINDLDMDNPEDRATFLGKFWSWVKGTGKNVAGVASEAAQKDWLPAANESTLTNLRR